MLSVILKNHRYFDIILKLSQVSGLILYTHQYFEIMVSMRSTARSLFPQFVKEEHIYYVTYLYIYIYMFFFFDWHIPL